MSIDITLTSLATRGMLLLGISWKGEPMPAQVDILLKTGSTAKVTVWEQKQDIEAAGEWLPALREDDKAEVLGPDDSFRSKVGVDPRAGIACRLIAERYNSGSAQVEVLVQKSRSRIIAWYQIEDSEGAWVPAQAQGDALILNQEEKITFELSPDPDKRLIIEEALAV